MSVAARDAEARRLPDCVAASPIDLVHLQRYTLGDRGLEREILELFLAQTPLTIDGLRDAATDKEWCMAAHTLKGSSRAVGAWGLAQLAEHAEQVGGIADAGACALAVERIETAVIETRVFIEALFHSS